MQDRNDLDENKMQFAHNKQNESYTCRAMKDADVFIGLSVGNVVSPRNDKEYGKKSNRFCHGKS